MAIDLEQFHQVFFEESLEGLDVMEQTLLQISNTGSDAETINTIFRSAHSIKGGSGTFGFSEIADFTHVMETLLDEAREGRRVITEPIIELLLKSCDCLRTMVMALQEKTGIDYTEAEQLAKAFEKILAEQDQGSAAAKDTPQPAAAPSVSTVPAGLSAQGILEDSIDTLLSQPGDTAAVAAVQAPVESGESSDGWLIQFTPAPHILQTGNEPVRILRELAALGDLSVTADITRLPELDLLSVDECFLSWNLVLVSDCSEEDIQEVFEWVIDDCELSVTRQQSHEPIAAEQAAPVALAAVEPSPVASQPDAASAPSVAAPSVEPVAAASAPEAASDAQESVATKTTSSGSIRVGIDKIDSLINLVGELVITQSMLSELGNNFEVGKLDRLSNGLEQLLQNTKELQESVMRIRMLPISFAFNRFPRMIRDLANSTGKKVALNVNGESTELDKTVMEQIGDPLVHLVRNAVDHGIETAEERIASGKSEEGTITLDAYHQGGNIVIEIGDDGKGLDADKILAKAIERGIVKSMEDLPEQKVFELIFEPGFSTAETVSNISGRGVGMDVVRRNITALGGRIEISSSKGQGSTFRVYLPLTLAILDGQLVRVGTETYIVPLISIVESLQIKGELVNQVNGEMVLYRLREDNVPIIRIYEEFGLQADSTELANSLLVVVEGEGQKVGLLVDDLLAQQQVVIKSLESNYKRVEGISGATILGDGSVSMILDIPGLIRKASERSSKQHQAA